VIAEEDRFSLHDLKRKGVTDTPGTQHDKQDAAGLSAQNSKPLVRPAAD